MPRGISRHKAAEKQTVLILDSRTKSAFWSDQNNLDMLIGACFNLSTSGGARSITGMTGGIEGRVIQLVNVGSDYIYLVNESTGSTASNRILTSLPAGAQFELAPNQSVFLSYNNVVGRWLVLRDSVVFDPETDAPLALMINGLRGFKRSGGLIWNSSPLQNKSEVRAVGGNQTISSTSYADITGATTSFVLSKASLVQIGARISAYASVSRDGSTYGLPSTWRGVLTLDVDGTDYVFGTQRAVIGADIGGGTDLDVLLTTGNIMAGTEVIQLAKGSHTAKLKAKKLSGGESDFTVENVSTAPSVITAVW
jgi:hypothetical protein